MRKRLELYAAELIIDSLTDTKRKALNDAVDEIEAAASSGSISVLAERDLAFHNRLYELADHPLLYTVWTENIAGKLRMLVNITTRTHDPLIDTGGNHKVLVDAINAKDRLAARKLISQHIDDAWRRASCIA